MHLRGYSYSGYKQVLIRSSAIDKHFDQTDLAQRQNSNSLLEDKYHVNWIHESFFLLPSFWIQDGSAYVGNGRHRFALLSKHMNELPAGFEGFKDSKRESRDLYDMIVVRALNDGETLDFPDLPVAYLGADINGEPTWKRYV
jgi:hypothetical protein